MESKLKAERMDQAGELPDFGNLLLREGGYPHLDDTPKQSQSDACKDCGGKGWIFVGFGEDHECETCFDKSPESENIIDQSKSDAWTDAYTLPTECKVYETQGETWGFAHQYWNGKWWGIACIFPEDAEKSRSREFYETTKWREVQP